MTNNLIMRATDLNRHYQQGDVTLSVLSGVNVSVEQGEKIAIVGVSGSGKTTLLNLLGGLDDADTGEVTLAGKSWRDLGASQRAAWRNQHVGFVYQFHHLLGEFSALENVAMPLLIGKCSVSEARQRAMKLLERVGLGDRLHHQPAELSGGERQRVAVARALVTEPLAWTSCWTSEAVQISPLKVVFSSIVPIQRSSSMGISMTPILGC